MWLCYAGFEQAISCIELDMCHGHPGWATGRVIKPTLRAELLIPLNPEDEAGDFVNQLELTRQLEPQARFSNVLSLRISLKNTQWTSNTNIFVSSLNSAHVKRNLGRWDAGYLPGYSYRLGHTRSHGQLSIQLICVMPGFKNHIFLIDIYHRTPLWLTSGRSSCHQQLWRVLRAPQARKRCLRGAIDVLCHNITACSNLHPWGFQVNILSSCSFLEWWECLSLKFRSSLILAEIAHHHSIAVRYSRLQGMSRT